MRALDHNARIVVMLRSVFLQRSPEQVVSLFAVQIGMPVALVDPGTAKDQALAALVEHLCRAGQRSLATHLDKIRFRRSWLKAGLRDAADATARARPPRNHSICI